MMMPTRMTHPKMREIELFAVSSMFSALHCVFFYWSSMVQEQGNVAMDDRHEKLTGRLESFIPDVRLLKALPFKFDTLEQEVNILLLLHLLKFDVGEEETLALKETIPSFHASH